MVALGAGALPGGAAWMWKVEEIDWPMGRKAAILIATFFAWRRHYLLRYL